MFKIAICEDDKYQIDINKLLINKWAEKKEISLSIRSFLSAEEFIIKNESIIEYDCIIIDVGLKKINGIELAKIIRENNKDVSIIFISGLEQYISYGYDFEAIHYLLKPVNEEKFLVCLDKAWKKKCSYKKEKDIITIKRFGDIINLKFDDIWICVNILDTKIRTYLSCIQSLKFYLIRSIIIKS